jgi:hypothetical protein
MLLFYNKTKDACGTSQKCFVDLISIQGVTSSYTRQDVLTLQDILMSQDGKWKENVK